MTAAKYLAGVQLDKEGDGSLWGSDDCVDATTKVRTMTGGKYITHNPYIKGNGQLISAGKGEDQKKRNEEQYLEQSEGTYSNCTSKHDQTKKGEKKRWCGAHIGILSATASFPKLRTK